MIHMLFDSDPKTLNYIQHLNWTFTLNICVC